MDLVSRVLSGRRVCVCGVCAFIQLGHPSVAIFVKAADLNVIITEMKVLCGNLHVIFNPQQQIM